MMRTAALLCLLGGALSASDRAQLGGRVEDPSGAVLVDVSLSAVNEETGIRRTARTDETGRYRIASLSPGIYKVTARKIGFQTLARLNVELTPGHELRLNMTMRVGSFKEVITVEDGPKLLRLDDGAVGVVAGRRLIDSLPLGGRGILSLVELAPGVIVTPASRGEAGQFSTNGQRSNTNYFTVDGVSGNTGVTGSVVPAQFAGGTLPAMTAFGSMQNLAALDSLQEVRIETSSFAPEFGRTPGAQVVLNTRSGSDEWHGSLSYLLRTSDLAAGDWFASSRGQRSAPFHLNQGSAALGGPLLRGRTFFFAAAEILRLRAPFAWLTSTPTASVRADTGPAVRPLLDAFPLPNGRDFGGGVGEFLASGSRSSRLDSGSLRVDHALTSRISLFGRYQEAPSSSQSGYSPIEQADFHARSLTVGVTATSGHSFVNDARLNVSADSVLARWLPRPPGGSLDLGSFLPPIPPVGDALYGVAIGGLGQLLSGQSGRNRQEQLHLVENLSGDHGAHALRFGAEYERLTPARESPALAVAGMWPSLSAMLAGAPMQTAVAQADQASSLIEILSFYAQDTWRPTPRLTLTYGLRWEITPAPSIRQSAQIPIAPPVGVAGGGGSGSSEGFPPTGPFLPFPVPSVPSSPGGGVAAGSAAGGPLWPTRYGQVAPRVGIAFRLSDRAVLRAGWGIFYDLSFSAATDPINGFPFNRWQVPLAGGVSQGGAGLGYGFMPDLRLPYAHEWNFSYERAFSAADVLTVSYLGSAGRLLLRREATLEGNTGVAQNSLVTNHASSRFHALEAAWRRKLAHGLEGIATYAWSHSIDNGSWDSAVALVGPGYSANNDRGSSSFDARHSFSGALSYALPVLARDNRWSPAASGWNVQAILRARSGFPIDVLTHENLLGFGFDNYPRPDLNPGVPIWIADPSVAGGRRLNAAAFTAPAGLQGNLGRNAITGFGMYQVDLALRRRFAIRESASLELGLAAFNALNHQSPADPVRYLNNPLFGQPVSLLNLMLGTGSPRSGLTPAFQAGGPRSLEISLKLRF